MKLKKLLSAALATAMALSLVACGGGDKPAASSGTPSQSSGGSQSEPVSSGSATEITVWIYPVGGWQTESNVKPLIDQFTADTGIKVNLEWLAYADGDDKVNTAISAKNAPDLIMEGPERLVANWGANGYMVDLSDMIDDTDRSEINAAALAACTANTSPASVSVTAIVRVPKSRYCFRRIFTCTSKPLLAFSVIA